MTSNMDFTDKAQATLAAAVQLAKDYANAQGKMDRYCFVLLVTNYILVAPPHLAFALLNEEAAAPIPGGVAGPSHGNTSLFTSAIQRAGGDPAIITRGVQRLLVRLPAQSPPPEETSLSSAALKILREAKELQTTMHDSVSDLPILH